MSIIAFVGGTIFDGRKEINNAVMLIDSDKIIAVGTSADIEIPKDATLVDVSNKTMIPGLIDCHIHIFMGAHRKYEHYMANGITDMEYGCIAVNNMRHLLKNGVTYVRDLGSQGQMIYALKGLLKEGVVVGPDFKVSGEALSITGGHGYWMSKECDGVDAYTKAVRESILEGCDQIKLMVTGGFDTPGKETAPCEMEYQEIEAAVREAHKKSRKVAVHAHGYTGLKYCIEAGVDSIEHGVYLDEELLIKMREKNIFLVPTLSAPHFAVKNALEQDPTNKGILESAKIIDRHNDAVKLAYKLGIKIAMGSDNGVTGNYFEDALSEIILLSKLGIPNLCLLKMATYHGAELLDIGDTHGSLESGKYADFIILDQNPLENIENIYSDKVVYKNGVEVLV